MPKSFVVRRVGAACFEAQAHQCTPPDHQLSVIRSSKIMGEEKAWSRVPASWSVESLGDSQRSPHTRASLRDHASSVVGLRPERLVPPYA